MANLEHVSVENFKKIIYLVPKLPRQAVIEFTNVCNLDCEMCPRKLFNRPMQHIDIDDYKRIIDALGSVPDIALVGYGEPLLHPNLKEAIGYAKLKGHGVSIITNGFPLVNKTVADELLFSGVDEIRFSVDSIIGNGIGHNSTNEVIQAIASFRKRHDEIRLQYREGITPNINYIRLIISPVLTKYNMVGIINLIGWAEKNRFDMVDIAHFNSIGGIASNISKEEEFETYRLIKRLNFHIPIATLYDRYKGFYKAGFRFMTKCPMSYDVCYIRLDGGISPCSCGLPNVVYGNIFKEPLHQIWNNNKFKNFRKKQHTLCEKCTLFKF